MTPPDDPDHPDLSAELLDVRERYGTESRFVHVDPDAPLEAAVQAGLRSDPHYAERLAAAWQALLATIDGPAGDAGFERAFRPLGPLPAGRGWADWARYVGGLIPRVAGGGPEFPVLSGPPAGHPLPFATARFLDAATANRAATEVLRRHEHQFRRWCADPEGRPRLQLYADLGRAVGTASGSVAEAARGSGGDGSGDGGPVALTGCVVLLRRDPEGRPYIATSHPEAVLAEEPRRRYPDLSVLLGGYFGQDLHELDRTPWDAEHHFAVDASAAVRARVAGQLRTLVQQPASELRADVVALGAYLTPDPLRRWLSGLARRLDELY